MSLRDSGKSKKKYILFFYTSKVTKVQFAHGSFKILIYAQPTSLDYVGEKKVKNLIKLLTDANECPLGVLYQDAGKLLEPQQF